MRLWNHLNSAQHKAAIPLICGVCFKYFPSTEGLIQHVESFHPKALKAPDTCKICAKTYSSVYKVMNHFTKCHPEYYACKDCLQIFKSKAELQEHSEKGHVKACEFDREGPIGDCGEGEEEEGTNVIEISRKENITNSVQDEDGIKNDHLPCEFCRKTFADSVELMKHKEEKHQSDVECLNSNSGAEEELLNIPEYDTESNALKRPRRSYSCEKCSIAFRSPSDLADHKHLKHISSVSDTKPYHCVQCDRHFTNKSSYWKHINSPAHLARRAQQKSITATVASQGNLMTGSQQSYSLNFQESTGNSSSAKAQNQGGLCPKVPFVYIPKSSLQGSLIHEGKTEVSCISDASTPGKVNDSKDKNDDNEGDDLTLRSENVEYNGKHGLSHSQSNNASCNVKLGRRKSEVRKVYSDGSDSKIPCYCQLCGKKWPALRGLWQHLIRNHRREAAVTCGVCLDVCCDYPSLASHLSSHHPENFAGEGNNFTCRICGRYHNARSKLIQHATIHIVLGPGPEHQPQSNLHNCQTCFRSFINEQNLHDHQKTHQSSNNVPDSGVQSEKLQHRCEVCYKVCGNVGALMTHRKSHKVNADDLFTRDEFVDMETEEVEHDITSNQGSENEHFYSCDICLKVFKNESLYSEHKQTHVKSSKSKNILVSHSKSQIPKQNFYICDICTLVFATETSFTAHSESHNLSFPTASPVSNAQHSSANDHSQDIQGFITAEPQRLAAKKDTFPCTICQTTFHNLAVLSTHFKVFHGKHFTCKHCKKKTFTSYVNLTQHIRICHLRKAQPRSLQGSIQLLKKWMERSHDNLDSQELSITKQSQIEIRDLNLLQENQNNESYSSIVGESEKVHHTITFQHLDRAMTIESTNDYFKNSILHKLTERNSVEESSVTNGESLAMSEYTDFIVDSELKHNEHRDDGSETQERSLSKINPIDSGGIMATSQNKSLLIENFKQNEMDVFRDSATEQKTRNIFGGNVERSDSEIRNSREDQFVCDAEIHFRLEDGMTDLINTENCLDVAMTKVSDTTPKHSKQSRELVSPSHSSEVPVMEEQTQDTSVTGQHSSVVSKFCDEIVGKYVIQNSPTCAGVLPELPIHVTGNTNKPNGNDPTGHGLGQDIMAEIVDNEFLSEEACDFSESNVTSVSGPLSASDGTRQKYVLDPLPVCKDSIKKNKDCLYSLEDALEELVAQNTE
jgi:hypothetical protein